MFELIVLIFIISISALLALFIYQNNPRSATNVSFMASSLAIIFWAIIMYLSVNTPDLAGTLFYIRLSMLAGTIMALSFLTLALCFPSTTFVIPKKWVITLSLMGLITCIVAMSPYMFTGLVVDGANIEPTPGWGIATFMLTSIGSNIATFVALIIKFFRSKGKVHEQLRFIVIGTLVMFFLLITGNFLAVIILKTSSFIFLGPLFTLTFLVSVAYAILRHKLLDIRGLVARAVSYTLLVTVIVLVEAFIVWLASRLLPDSIDRTLVAIGGSLIIVLSYNVLSRIITRATDRIFFQGRYDTDGLLKSLTDIMVREMDIAKLSHALLTTMSEQLRVADAAFVILKEKGVRSVEYVGFAKQIPFSNSTLEHLLAMPPQVWVFEELVHESDKEYFRTNNFTLILPLVVQNEKIGFLILGPKSSGDIYEPRDLEFLNIFAPQAAIAIKNAESYREIQEFNMTLSGKVAERTRELEASQAEQLKLKDEFVFIATHDLATPVTAISGFSAMIKARKEQLSTELSSNLKAIDEASERLKVLVNDLLQVARSDAGTIKVQLVPVDAGKVIEAAVRQTSPLAKEKQVTVTTKLGSNNMIMADPTKLAEVVENLISNAIKYNRQGGSLTITSKEDVKTVTLEFSDTGLGIKSEEQAKVFTKFFRSETPEVRQRPGTGLGLFVVRMLTEKMGGKISFESKFGIGTTFKLVFSR